LIFETGKGRFLLLNFNHDLDAATLGYSRSIDRLPILSFLKSYRIIVGFKNSSMP